MGLRTVCGALLWLLMMAGQGCLFYQQPPPHEPHAKVRLRLRYHHARWGRLSQQVTINGFTVFVVDQAHGDPPLRLRLEPTRWRFYTKFSRDEMYMDHESTLVTETIPCGTQTTTPAQTAATPYGTQQRTVHSSVWKTREVVSAWCDARADHQPRAGVTYVLKYDYYGSGRCELRCYEERQRAGNRSALVPCR